MYADRPRLAAPGTFSLVCRGVGTTSCPVGLAAIVRVGGVCVVGRIIGLWAHRNKRKPGFYLRVKEREMSRSEL